MKILLSRIIFLPTQCQKFLENRYLSEGHWKTIEGGQDMKHSHIHMGFWIEELKSYGIYEGPNGEPLEKMGYYDLRAFLVKTHLQLNIEVKASPWF